MASVVPSTCRVTTRSACRLPGHTPLPDTNDCSTCLTIAAKKKHERAQKDRRAEFYDDSEAQLTVRLTFDGSMWAAFVEYQPRRQPILVGMHSEYEEREDAAERFRAIVRQVMTSGWRPGPYVSWDLRLVDPRRIDHVDV